MLRWLAPPEWVDDLEGDLEEGHRRRLERHGRTVADLLTSLEALDMTVAVVREHLARWISDTWIAVRTLRRTPGFALVTILTFAVGIGASTAIFSVVDGVLLRPLPYKDPNRIVKVTIGVRPGPGRPEDVTFSDRGFRFFASNDRSFEALAGYFRASWAATLTGGGSPREIHLALMSPGAFRILGVQPERGRLPTKEESLLVTGGRIEPGRTPVVLLSDGLWKERYGSDPGIIGKTITLDGQPCQVIGVMPPGYDFPHPHTDAWAAVRPDPASANWGSHYLQVIGRLRAGATIASAEADARRLIGRFAEAGYPRSWVTQVFDGSAHIVTLESSVVGNVRLPLLLLMGAVGFVLLIACANVANLMVVRGEARARESAVRLALGSSRTRLVQHRLAEALPLALAGGVAGVVLAYVGVRTLVALAPPTIPRLGGVGIHGSVLAFATAVSVGSGLLVGLFPALRSSSQASLAELRNGGTGSTTGGKGPRLRNGLVVVEVALALVLLVGSGLMLRTFQRLRDVNPGFRPDHVLTFRVYPSEQEYGGAAGIALFYEQLIDRLGAIPGVSAVGGTQALPLIGRRPGAVERTVDEFASAETEVPPVFTVVRVTPGYFRAMGIPVLEGRAFNDGDSNLRLGSLVISKAVKERYWPNTSALGKRISAGGVGAHVVGVVGDVHAAGLDTAVTNILYYPMLDSVGGGVGALNMVVRTRIDPRAIVPDVRRVIRKLDPDIPIDDVRPMRDIVADSMSRTTFTMCLLALAAVIALFLGAVGIYGVLSYTVRQRTGEIGIRMALGADARRLRRSVLARGLALAATGVVIGLAGAAGLGWILGSLLYGVSRWDPASLCGGAVVFLAVAALASLIPAERAVRIPPADALRAE